MLLHFFFLSFCFIKFMIYKYCKYMLSMSGLSPGVVVGIEESGLVPERG